MESGVLARFSEQLRKKGLLVAGADASSDLADIGDADWALRRLWESTEISASDFADEVAIFFDEKRIELPDLLAAKSFVLRFSSRFLREMLVFPYQLPDGHFELAVGDPTDLAAVRAAEIVLGTKVKLRVASFEDIATALDQKLNEEQVASPNASGVDSDENVEGLRDLASGAPVVRAVNDLFEKAVELRASDIHLEPFKNRLVVRMRIDGLLRVFPSPAGVLPQAIISRIKILAGLNIAERRLPQDGSARLVVARSEIDIRVAVMPTQYGESTVLRLLPKDRGLLAVEKLGFAPADEKRIRSVLALPHGMIVIAGPTGSGKTTTLATFLSLLNEPTRKILTIEDPVEYEIQGVNQSQIKPSIGLTFAAALRAFVRQDPDVIMVGEVRDAETAHIAVHAALTGHLVLTTLHTETAAAAIPRLLDLGVEGFLLTSTLRAVVAQRLVRQLCDRCKVRRVLAASDFAMDSRYSAMGLKVGEAVYEPGGCERCSGTGYRGRIGVFEILEMAEEIRGLVTVRTDAATIDQAAMRAGMTTMIEDGAAKCRAGWTSPAEVLRVATIR
jgi:general secretion pathway protein E